MMSKVAGAGGETSDRRSKEDGCSDALVSAAVLGLGTLLIEGDDKEVSRPWLIVSSSRGKNEDSGTGGNVENAFLAGLRVLVVGNDPLFLQDLEQKLQTFYCIVTTCSCAIDASSMLLEKKYKFDFILSALDMRNGHYQLLEKISMKTGLPLVAMSCDDSGSVVTKGVTGGACDQVIKPTRVQAMQNICQHAVQKRRNKLKELERSGNIDGCERHLKSSDNAVYSSLGNDRSLKILKRMTMEREDSMKDSADTSTLNVPRVVWSVQLNRQFSGVVRQLGIDEAVPEKILELMNAPGLTLEDVATHLQECRSRVEKIMSGSKFLAERQAELRASIQSKPPSPSNFDLHGLSTMDNTGLSTRSWSWLPPFDGNFCLTFKSAQDKTSSCQKNEQQYSCETEHGKRIKI